MPVFGTPSPTFDQEGEAESGFGFTMITIYHVFLLSTMGVAAVAIFDRKTFTVLSAQKYATQ